MYLFGKVKIKEMTVVKFSHLITSLLFYMIGRYVMKIEPEVSAMQNIASLTVSIIASVIAVIITYRYNEVKKAFMINVLAFICCLVTLILFDGYLMIVLGLFMV